MTLGRRSGLRVPSPPSPLPACGRFTGPFVSTGTAASSGRLSPRRLHSPQGVERSPGPSSPGAVSDDPVGITPAHSGPPQMAPTRGRQRSSASDRTQSARTADSGLSRLGNDRRLRPHRLIHQTNQTRRGRTVSAARAGRCGGDACFRFASAITVGARDGRRRVAGSPLSSPVMATHRDADTRPGRSPHLSTHPSTARGAAPRRPGAVTGHGGLVAAVPKVLRHGMIRRRPWTM